MDDPLECSATELSRRIRQRSISCRELMQHTLERVHSLNPRFNALVSLQDGDDLLRQADERDAQLRGGERCGWMHGFPLAVKDLSAVRGIPTTRGSPLFKNNVPDFDALFVQRMKQAGAIVIGKTNTPEFGLGSHTYNTVFGTTFNAYDETRTAGGSSGGAAVALALRMLPVADGSDMGGSLRNPAAFNNVYGLRPSFGRVPSVPALDNFFQQLGTEGPMARSPETSPACWPSSRAAMRARRCRSTASLSTPIHSRCHPRWPGCASAGSAASGRTCRWRRASWTCARADSAC